ncbi:MAG: hypothetical protein KDA83_03600 [Planctomycetales bacterium]|nr:hypothetical protein [Planctomycetales bacterium]
MAFHLPTARLAWIGLLGLLGLVLASGCKVGELDASPVSPLGVPLRGSDIHCSTEEDRGTPRAIGNLRTSQYGLLPVCRDEMADKVVPWHAPPDCDGRELVLERVLGRRRIGHTVPVLGWLGLGRFSEPGLYETHRTTQIEQQILHRAIAYFCIKDSMTIDGVRFSDDDVIAFDGQHVTKLIDGDDIGTGREEIDAFAVLSPTAFLISYRGDFEIDEDHPLPGLTGMVRDEDILMFEASSLGEVTRGVFSRFLDPSHLGIDPSTDIDALEVDNEDVLYCSFDRRTRVGDLTVEPSDVVELRLERTDGRIVAANWRRVLRGADHGLGDQDIDGLSLGPHGEIVFSLAERHLRGDSIHDPADALILEAESTPEDEPFALGFINGKTPLSPQGTNLSENNLTAFALLR